MDEDSEASLHKVVGSEWIESKVDAGENVQHANKQELKTKIKNCCENCKFRV